MDLLIQTQAFLGWCAVLNIGLLLFSTIIVVLFQHQVSQLHAKIFNIDKEDVFPAYFQYLGEYKILIIVLNIVPYFAIGMMH